MVILWVGIFTVMSLAANFSHVSAVFHAVDRHNFKVA